MSFFDEIAEKLTEAFVEGFEFVAMEVDGIITRCREFGHKCNKCYDRLNCNVLQSGSELNERGEIIND